MSIFGSIILLIVFMNGQTASAQNVPRNITIPRDTSYSIDIAEAKVKKKYPAILRVHVDTLRNIRTIMNVVYAHIGARELHLDIVQPLNRLQKFPALLLIHGGAWRSGDRSMEMPMASSLASTGYVTATVEYRLSPEAGYPAAVIDLMNAVRWLRANAETLGIDPGKIGIYGCSSGGHLASLMGMTNGKKMYDTVGTNGALSSSVQAVVNVDGPLDLTDPEESGKDIDPAKPSACAQWFGATYKDAPDMWIDASPVHHVSRYSAPIAFINSSLERYHVGRDEMRAALTKLGIYSEVHTLDDSPHSFWLFHPWYNSTFEFARIFFDRTLKGM